MLKIKCHYVVFIREFTFNILAVLKKSRVAQQVNECCCLFTITMIIAVAGCKSSSWKKTEKYLYMKEVNA